MGTWSFPNKRILRNNLCLPACKLLYLDKREKNFLLTDIIPSLTVNKRQNSRKACIYGLCGCLFVCIDMCYIFAFVLVIFFVFEIIPRMEAFDINSKSVLNPNEL